MTVGRARLVDSFMGLGDSFVVDDCFVGPDASFVSLDGSFVGLNDSC